jgi:hypothetical protein
MTQLLFHAALLNCCDSKKEKLRLENNIPFKILLILVLPDILLLLVIFIPLSKWCFFLHTPPP